MPLPFGKVRDVVGRFSASTLFLAVPRPSRRSWVSPQRERERKANVKESKKKKKKVRKKKKTRRETTLKREEMWRSKTEANGSPNHLDAHVLRRDVKAAEKRKG